ncbi:hypothetical protein N0V93_001876 [Gnomoniopsis smithogilvyi]|uniref:NAD-dependent epimerase/dehydratase domain-containing protein n=1 Tax=Gnomoniopsis smithogilvyi TaxID=1191159 RepID=A0A9W8Z4T2_9PEZI|nr:hypothetical protein N0V93_001876 [Gnomoniopsis smithogilvyi]
MSGNVFITGATGLIGFRILLAALAAGHHVRYAVRSEEKARIVESNPAIQKLRTTMRDFPNLSSVFIPDFTADGAFDAAVESVTHIIHVGSPVPMPTFDPTTQVFEPMIKITAGLLQSALKSPSVKRVVITSSIVANLSESAEGPVSASTRVPPPNPIPETFKNVMEAYVVGRRAEMQNLDLFARDNRPHFTIARVHPGYVFGRNELALDATMMHTQNNSNNFLMLGFLGGELPFPVHGAFAHIDDVAEVYLRLAFESNAGAIGLATKIDYASVFDIIEKRYPEAVKVGVFKKGKIPTLPVDYDSSDAEALLGGFRSFESAVADVAGQYLELLDGNKEH